MRIMNFKTPNLYLSLCSFVCPVLLLTGSSEFKMD
jgi:hypothetical protein